MTLIHWSRGISGLFTDAADWSTGTVPTAGDDVEIIARALGPYTVTADGNHTIETLDTGPRVTLAVNSGLFSITDGTGTGASEGTISVADGAALEIGGLFRNTGTISLNSTGDPASLLINGNVTLTGSGIVMLSPDGDDVIGGALVKRIGHFPTFFRLPFPPFFRFFPFTLFPTFPSLTNHDLIEGAGTIGGRNLSLVNDGMIIGNSALAAMTLDTGSHQITNFGVIDGATAPGVVIVSDVTNQGRLEAEGRDANLTLDGTVTQIAAGTILTSGVDAATFAGLRHRVVRRSTAARPCGIGRGQRRERDPECCSIWSGHAGSEPAQRAYHLVRLDCHQRRPDVERHRQRARCRDPGRRE